MRALGGVKDEPAYYIVGRYGFDLDLQVEEDVWINWQIANRTFEIPAKVTQRRKEVHMDGTSILLNMSDREKAQLAALYPNGLEALKEGASLFLLRIFVETTDEEALYKIQEEISKSKKILTGQKRLPDSV
ncbi:MAG: hypothetical protein ACFB16_14465 [Phormidesmis sp.]